MNNYEFYKEKLGNILSKRRFIHSVNVGKLAEKLAIHYGIDVNRAKIAGLLHDVCKEMDEKTMIKLLSEAKPEIYNAFKNFPFKLCHGPAATVYLKKEFGIEDEEILDAVCFHTTGRANMTMMEKIVAMADYSSYERIFADIKDMEELAMKNIDKAVFRKCSLGIKTCINKSVLIHPYTVEAYNDILEKEGK